MGKSVTIYLFIILAIRIFGKNELAQLSVVDLVFILLISNAVQNAMVGSDSSLMGGIVAASGLFVVNYVFKFLMRRYNRFSKIIEGDKIILVHEGEILKAGLAASKLSIDELERAVREHGIETIENVNLAVLEVDGNISILSDNFKRKSSRPRHKPQLSHNP